MGYTKEGRWERDGTSQDVKKSDTILQEWCYRTLHHNALPAYIQQALLLYAPTIGLVQFLFTMQEKSICRFAASFVDREYVWGRRVIWDQKLHM